MKIAIGIISRDLIHASWLEHFLKVLEESKKMADIEVIQCYDKSKHFAQARNEIINKVLVDSYDYLWFIDDDVFVPLNTLELLLKANKDLISGIYWTRSDIDQRTTLGYDFWKEEKEEIFKQKNSNGLGCCLIKTDLLRKMDRPIIPPFIKVNNGILGEDCAFFKKAKEFTIPFVHSKVLCDHYDYHKDKFYPDEKVCMLLTGRKRLCYEA